MKTREGELDNSAFREAHLRDYWKIIWQARWTIIAIFFVIVSATAVWTFLQTPVFQATATVEVQPKARNLAAGQDASGMGAAGYGWFAEEKYHNTQVEIIRSRDIAMRVVDTLDLHSHPMFSELTDPVEAFRGLVHVVPRRDTGLIEISMMGIDRDEITRWVNGVASAYVDRNLDKAKENVEVAISAIREQMDALQEEFSAAETERFDALQGSQLFNSEDQVEIVRERLKSYNQELTTVELELSHLRDTLDAIGKMQQESDLATLPEVSEDAQLMELYRKKIDLERQLESAKVDLLPSHPEYEKIEKEIARVESGIRDQLGVLMGGLYTRHELATDHEKYLREQIRGAEGMSLEVGKATSVYGQYKTRADTKKRILDLIAKTMTEVQFGAELMNNNVNMLDEATPPPYPIKPRKRVNLAIGGMLGLFLGVAAAFFLDYLDNTFRTPEDIEKYLGLAVLGVIPKVQRSEGLANRGVREAFQSLRTSIIFSSANRQKKLILISSTGPQEGKSSTVANLARTLAAAGDRVIIIDCDLRRPTQHMHHELGRDHGVTNYLTAPLENTDWASFVSAPGPKNLDIMTCGPIPPSPPELLGSERFAAMLQEMRGVYDWILVDSPPAASLADCTLLASLADMQVIVVQHNRTDRDLVAKTVQRLRAVNDTMAGAVLNNVDLDRAYNKDYYYAGYYYYTEGAEGPVKKRRDTPKKASVG
ncbi:MAG: polysaccharide biosynthesis tyrosine autokinase [bacterium]|nr:polysaccharide biosynthesis tyrosine autokinase [bacterium]